MSAPSGIPAQAVYPWWLRINLLAKHEALCPSLQHPTPQKGWPHIEISTARGLIPLFQKFSNKTILDGHPVALSGHDVGPMAPHLCTPPDNTMLPVILMGSSCKWPVPASRRKIEGKSPCAFMHFIVPYLHCHDRGKKEEPKPETSKPAPDAGPKKGTASEQLAIFAQGAPGLGLVMIPTGSQTVIMTLGWRDFLLGLASLLVDMAFGYVWKRYKKIGQSSGLQPAAARRLGATDEAGKQLLESAADEALKGYLKSFLSDAELEAPGKLAKLDLKSGEVFVYERKVLDTGWKLSDSLPLDYRGWKPHVDQGAVMLGELLEGAFHAG